MSVTCRQPVSKFCAQSVIGQPLYQVMKVGHDTYYHPLNPHADILIGTKIQSFPIQYHDYHNDDKRQWKYKGM